MWLNLKYEEKWLNFTSLFFDFALSSSNINVIAICAAHWFDLSAFLYVNKEILAFTINLQKSLKNFSHMQIF